MKFFSAMADAGNTPKPCLGEMKATYDGTDTMGAMSGGSVTPAWWVTSAQSSCCVKEMKNTLAYLGLVLESPRVPSRAHKALAEDNRSGDGRVDNTRHGTLKLQKRHSALVLRMWSAAPRCVLERAGDA